MKRSCIVENLDELWKASRWRAIGRGASAWNGGVWQRMPGMARESVSKGLAVEKLAFPAQNEGLAERESRWQTGNEGILMFAGSVGLLDEAVLCSTWNIGLFHVGIFRECQDTVKAPDSGAVFHVEQIGPQRHMIWRCSTWNIWRYNPARRQRPARMQKAGSEASAGVDCPCLQ